MFISIVIVLVSTRKCLQAMMFKKHMISVHTVRCCSTSVWTLRSIAHLFKAQSALIGQLTQAWTGINSSGIFVTMAVAGGMTV